MPIPQAPPGGGAAQPREHFRYVPTPTGTKWHAYLAGAPHWFLAHTRGKSKPCLRVMTGGELICERCEQITPPQVIGYVPLYREVDSRPVMVIVYEYQRDQLVALKLHQRVLIGREEQQSDGVWISPALNSRPLFQTTLKHRMVSVDLTDVLLKLWGLPELTHWYSVTHGKVEHPVAVAVKPVEKPVEQEEQKQSNGKPFGPMYRNAAKRAAKNEDGPLAEEYGALVNRVKEIEKNGKHKPTTEGK